MEKFGLNKVIAIIISLAFGLLFTYLFHYQNLDYFLNNKDYTFWYAVAFVFICLVTFSSFSILLYIIIGLVMRAFFNLKSDVDIEE